MKSIQKAIVKFVLRIYTQILYRVKVIGKKNIPEEGAALLCPNHVHVMDSVSIITRIKRPLRALAKDSLYKYAIMRWLAYLFGVYSVNRETAAVSATKIALKLLKENEIVLIFPEGTRNGMEKGIKPRDRCCKYGHKDRRTYSTYRSTR